jgi:DNA-binding transcriptional LysR family regulator
MLLADEIELGIVRDSRHEEADLEESPLYGDELVLATAPGRPLARATRVSLSDLSGERLVVLSQVPGWAVISRAILRGAGTPPRHVIQVDNAAVACELIRGGVAIGWVPLTCVTDDFKTGLLVRVPVADGPTIRTRIVALEHRSPTSATVKAFVAAMREAGSVAGSPVQHLEARRPRQRREREQPVRRTRGTNERASGC